MILITRSFLGYVKKYFLSTAVSGTFICICLLFLHADMQMSRAPEQISIQNCSCWCLRSSRAPFTLCIALFLQIKLELMPYQHKSSAGEDFQNSKHLKNLILQLLWISQNLQKEWRWRKPTENRQQNWNEACVEQCKCLERRLPQGEMFFSCRTVWNDLSVLKIQIQLTQTCLQPASVRAAYWLLRNHYSFLAFCFWNYFRISCVLRPKVINDTNNEGHTLFLQCTHLLELFLSGNCPNVSFLSLMSNTRLLVYVFSVASGG